MCKEFIVMHHNIGHSRLNRYHVETYQLLSLISKLRKQGRCFRQTNSIKVFYFYLQSHFLPRLLKSQDLVIHTPLSSIHLRRTQLQKVSNFIHLFIYLIYLFPFKLLSKLDSDQLMKSHLSFYSYFQAQSI